MKYYVVADVHGFYSILHSALEDAGFFSEAQPHKLIVLGDLFDRGTEARELQNFILELMEKDQVILIRGNHEDLYEELVTKDEGRSYSHHRSNGTYDTALQLTGFDMGIARYEHVKFASAGRKTPYYKTIMPAMLDWFETKHYVFVHGWVPCAMRFCRFYEYRADWREADPNDWSQARWDNGIEAARNCHEEKTVFCGHWHTSYGHSRFENNGSEFGEDADFSPYIAPGIIALDACTAHSGKINVYIIEDDEMQD